MSKQPWRILVADDDPTAALLFRAALSGDDFVLEVADNGTDALAIFRRQDFDLALLDVEMPGLDGTEVCAAIRQTHGAGFPVLLVTGRNDAEFLDRALTLSAGYIGKPIDWSSLQRTVRGLLESSAR